MTDIGQDEELTLKINDVESFSTLEPYTGGDQKSLVALLKSRNSSPDSCGLFLESHLLLGQMSLDVLTGYGLRDSSSDITQQLPLDAAALKRFSVPMIRVIEQATGATVTLVGDLLTIVQDPQLLRETLLLVDNLKVGGNRVSFLRVMIKTIQGFQGRTQENKLQLQAYVTSCVLIELQCKVPLGGLFGLNLHRRSLRHLKIVYESISPLANVLNRISQGSVFTMLGDVDEDYNRGDNVESNPEDRTKRRKFLHTDAPDPYSGKTAHGGACASMVQSHGSNREHRLHEKCVDAETRCISFYQMLYQLPNGYVGVGGAMIPATSSEQVIDNVTRSGSHLRIVAPANKGKQYVATEMVKLLTCKRRGCGFSKHPDNKNGNTPGYHHNGKNPLDWRREKHVFFKPGFTEFNTPPTGLRDD